MSGNTNMSFFFSGDRSRQRRRRTAFTDEQLDRLEESFANERFPGIKIRENLAGELNIGEDRIQVRYSNSCHDLHPTTLNKIR